MFLQLKLRIFTENVGTSVCVAKSPSAKEKLTMKRHTRAVADLGGAPLLRTEISLISKGFPENIIKILGRRPPIYNFQLSRFSISCPCREIWIFLKHCFIIDLSFFTT